ncbi:hypothetical protein CROQUDRAFT_36526 [Cronartium quercuum f. sp. fusiforme G11]|uniref:CUE domain-containing protein n=1 Tax=Cronartium quercuum f. sp. fusiforme G11 TaxID=708437 RepID=A0A9P6NU31_9BASI|nr:hypothetical protein CROQUDRAFT_36526 [Cronartium quercuum f. sp. fusiforme G11]
MSSASTFTHAPLTKASIMGCCILSLSLSGHKHFLNLPLSPHLTRDFQLWRIVSHHLVCSNSADIFLIVLILWSAAVPVERIFGTIKYASFLLVTMTIGSFLELIALVIGHQLFDYRAIPSGPFLLTFAILHQHQRAVPALYQYALKPFTFDSHTLTPHLLALVLFCFNPVSSALGLLTGALYRTDSLGLNRWRIPSRLLMRFIHQSAPTPAGRRPTHSRLADDPRMTDEPGRSPAVLVRTSVGFSPNPAPALASASASASAPTPVQVRTELESELGPTETVVTGLMSMFPGRSREEISAAWIASRGDLPTAVDLILHSNTSPSPSAT